MADVILIGASVRALADSARRAWLRPLCVDLFRDADLLAQLPNSLLCPFEQYPEGFLTALQSLPPLPVIYSGGLENYPSLIDQIAARHEIWGNDGSVLRLVRDPFLLNRFLLQNGWRSPAIRSNPPADEQERWLRKRKLSSAGRGIRQASISDQRDDEHFFQELIPGVSYSAAFVVPDATRPQTEANYGAGRLVGISEQLIGCEWLNAKPFWYCGNIGPIRMQSSLLQSIENLGRLACEFKLRGCYGIDMVVNEGGIFSIEVNPRYTASMEIFERHTPGVALLADRGKLDFSQAKCIGKAVWHTSSACRVNVRSEDLSPEIYSDLPHYGQEFGSHEPLVSIFATASDRDAVMNLLKERAAEIPNVFRLEPI